MRFLILNSDYTDFLNWHYARDPELEGATYDQQLSARYATFFGVSDFYSRNLRTLGHDAANIFVNNPALQKAWARKEGLNDDVDRPRSWVDALDRFRQAAARTPLRRLRPLFRSVINALEDRMPPWQRDILLAQVEDFKPDIILNQTMRVIPPDVISALRGDNRLMVGQIASPIPEKFDCRGYDLVISSLPNFVERFRKAGIPARLHRFGFDPMILEKLGPGDAARGASFVGNLYGGHRDRIRLMTSLSDKIGLQWWGPGVDSLPPNSPLRFQHRGIAWGLDMYRVIRDSALALNHHIDVAGPWANNMRLFETTGVGTLLLTDWKENLAEMFEPGIEVVTYKSVDGCRRLVEYYLNHDEERTAIAKAGQQRTLRDHNYRQRMRELITIVEDYI